MYNLVEFIKSKKDTQYIFKNFQLTCYDNQTNIFIYCIPLLALSFFFYKGLNNNFNYLTDAKVEETLSCPEGYTLKNIVFNDKSGFYINDSKSERQIYQKDFRDILDYYSDFAVLSSSFGIPVKFKSLSNENINDRDSFKVLEYLFNFSDSRLYSGSIREQNLLGLIGNVYISGGGFFIYPVNKQSKSLESLIILQTDTVERGFNNINICL